MRMRIYGSERLRTAGRARESIETTGIELTEERCRRWALDPA